MTLPSPSPLLNGNTKNYLQLKSVGCLFIHRSRPGFLPSALKPGSSLFLPIRLSGKELTIQVPSQFFLRLARRNTIMQLWKKPWHPSWRGCFPFLFYRSRRSPCQYFRCRLFEEYKFRCAAWTLFSPCSHPFRNLQAVQSNLNPGMSSIILSKETATSLRALPLSLLQTIRRDFVQSSCFVRRHRTWKTHLMHALGNHAESAGKAKRILYFPAKNLRSILSKRYSPIRWRFFPDVPQHRFADCRRYSVFFRKEKTQDNFFHIFKRALPARQADRTLIHVPPKELKGLDERLISRFQCGLTADIQPPDLETRIAILRKKSEENAFELPQDIIEFIAANVTSNIRELEGCLVSLLARASLENRELISTLQRRAPCCRSRSAGAPDDRSNSDKSERIFQPSGRFTQGKDTQTGKLSCPPDCNVSCKGIDQLFSKNNRSAFRREGSQHSYPCMPGGRGIHQNGFRFQAKRRIASAPH